MYHRILATLSFFTRLPFWRLADIPGECYRRVVPLWPLVGWLTGGIMALVACAAALLPTHIAAVLCLVARMLTTGALHEDGFADFCDGFGGGTTRQRILDIMKDSHIGTYGVLGLIVYALLQTGMLTVLLDRSTGILDTAAFLIVADTWCKWVSSTIILFLPYARKESEAKTRLTYSRVTVPERLLSLALGVLPMCVFLPHTSVLTPPTLLAACAATLIAAALLFRYMHRRIAGYTGDCCGATFLITECLFCLVLVWMGE